MNYIKNKIIIISIIISVAVLLLIGFLVYLYNENIFWENICTLIGGGIGGIATFVTVLVLLSTNKKQNEKKELAEYCANLSHLLDEFSQYVRNKSDLDELERKEDKLEKTVLRQELSYYKCLDYYHRIKNNPITSDLHKTEMKCVLTEDKLKHKKRLYKNSQKKHKEVKNKMIQKDEQSLINDDKILASITQIKIQLSIFINVYCNNKEVKNAELLYHQIEKYYYADDRENLDMDILDNLSDDINEFIDNTLKTLQK